MFDRSNQNHPLSGVYCATITPLSPALAPDLEGIPRLLEFLARRGCDGALILGTTGEGPSFSPEQRMKVFQAAVQIRQVFPAFRLLAGTGTPSLDETIQLTRLAYDLGFDGVVVLPPYYFRKASDQGLFEWFLQVIGNSVPAGGHFFGYHIPDVSGVALSIELLSRLKDAFPDRFTGTKDSSGNRDFAKTLGKQFGKDLVVFTGNDRLLSFALENQAAGCITACANLISPDLQQVWKAFLDGKPDQPTQEKINHSRQIIESCPPLPSIIKAILAKEFGFPEWSVCPPLQPTPADICLYVISQLELA